MASATARAAAQTDADEAERLAAEQAAEGEPQVEAEQDVPVETSDERLGAGRDEAADEAAKAQKAAERRARKERQRLARERLTNENQALKQQVAQLAAQQAELYQRVTKNDGTAIESRIAEINQKLQTATVIVAKAAKSTVPTAEQDLAEALNIRDQLLEARQNLTQAKQYQEQRQQQQQEQPAQRPVPESIRRQAREFASENDWYSPAGAPGRNRESEIADRISANLDAEGLDPTTAEYWTELRARCRTNKAIGHLLPEEDEVEAVETDDEDAPAPKRTNGGPRMTAGGRERPLKRGEVYIPRELKENMQEAGIWDDPKARARVIKNYQASLRSQRAN